MQELGLASKLVDNTVGAIVHDRTLSDDPELLQDMILAAVTEAIRSAQELAASRMGSVSGLGGAGGLGLPGL